MDADKWSHSKQHKMEMNDIKKIFVNISTESFDPSIS